VAHNSTILAQLLELVPRHEFETLAKRHHEGRELRGTTRWKQFVAMAAGQLAGRCSLISQGVFLVTRMKRGGVRYKVVERRAANRSRGVTSDRTIEFTSAKGRKRCPHRLRRIGYRDSETGRRYVFLTTNFALSAKTVADIYKSRWQVELFFKWIKQNLKIKSFVGTSRNAVMTQIWIAMCVHLLLAHVKFVNRLAWGMQHILRLLQLNLFDRRSLLALLDPPPAPPGEADKQLELNFCR